MAEKTGVGTSEGKDSQRNQKLMRLFAIYHFLGNAEAGLKLFRIPLANYWRHEFDGELPSLGRGFQDQGFRVSAFLKNRGQSQQFNGANALDDACPRDRDKG
jgi:hypothetical protein